MKNNMKTKNTRGKRYFSTQDIQVEHKRINGYLEAPSKNPSQLMMDFTLTMRTKLNDGVEMTDYQYTRYKSKVTMRVRNLFNKHFTNELTNLILEFPEMNRNNSKTNFITLSLMFKNEIIDWKGQYDAEVESFLREAYDEIKDYKYYL